MAERGTGSDMSDEGLDMLSRLFEEEVPEEELLNQLIPRVPSSVDEELQRRVADILTRNGELEFRLSVLENENKNLQEKNSLLRSNLMAVYRKSLAEIKFRDSQIVFLKKQLQSIKIAQLTADNDSRLSQNPFKLPNVSKDRGAGFPLDEPCLSVYSADQTTNDKHGLSDNRTKEKVCLSSPDQKSTDVSSIPDSITISLDSKGTALNSKEFSQNEVMKDSLVVCDDADLSQVNIVDSGQRIEDSSNCNLKQVSDSNFASAVEGQETVVAHGGSTIEDSLKTAVVKHFAQMPTASLPLSAEHNCLKSVNLLEASSLKELNAVASLVEDANTLERNLLLTNSDSSDKAGNNKHVTFSQQTALVLKCSDSDCALNSRCKADDSIAQESCLFTERAKEKASDERCSMSSGSVNSDLVLFNDKAVSVADEKAVQREIQRNASRKNNAEDVSLAHKSNETSLQTLTEKRRNLDLNLEKSRNQSNELKTSSTVDLRLKIQSKTSHHSSRNSLHSECSSIESSKDKWKGFKDKTGEAHLGRDDNSRRGRNDESSRKRSSSISEVGDRICEQKTTKQHRGSEKDLKSHKRKSSTGEKDDKEPHMKKGKYEGCTIQEKLLRLSVLETAASHCREDLPATSSDCKQLDELQRRSSSQSALVVLPERSVLETDKHSPNTPEIEQMQRYIQLAHRHNVAQKIIQKEAAKHVNKIIEEKKLAATKRREVDAMFDSSIVSSQDDDKISKKNKRLDSDVVRPSPTLFSRRAEAKLKQANPAMTAKVGQSLGKLNDINPENRDLIFDETAVNFQLECLKNVSVESLELSKILQTVSTKSVLESSCGKVILKGSSCAVVSSEQSFPHVSSTDQSVTEAGTVSSNRLAEHLTLSELVHSTPRPAHSQADSNQPLDQNLTAPRPSCETSKMNSESDSLCCSTPLHLGAEIQIPCQQQEANQNDNHSKIFDLLCRNSPGSPDVLFDVAVAGKTPRTEHEYSTDKASKLMNESFDRDFYADLESVQLEDLGVDGISTEYPSSVHVMEGTLNDVKHFFDPFTRLDNANFAEKSTCVLNSNKELKCMTNNAARPDHLILSAESDHTRVMVSNEAVNGGEICGLVSLVSQRESKLGNDCCKIQEEPNLLLDHKSTLKPAVGSLEAENDALSTGFNDDLCDVSFNEPELLQVHASEEGFDFLQSGIADQLFGNLSFSSSSESEKLSKDKDREFKAVDTKEIIRGCMGDDELEEGELEDSLQNTLGPSQELHDSHSRNEKRCSNKWKKRRSWSQVNLRNGKRKVEQQNDSRHHQTASEKIRRPSRSRSPESTLSLKSKTRHSDDEVRRHNRHNKHQTHSQVRQQYRCSSDRKSHASRSLDRNNHHKKL